MAKNSTSFSSEYQPKRRRGKSKPIKDLVEAIGKTKPGKKIGDAIEKVLGIRPDTFNDAHALALYKSAILDGNIKASELLLKIQRQYPRDEVDVTTAGKPLDTKFQIEIIDRAEDVKADGEE